MLRRIIAVMYKEWLHIARDRIALLMLIFFPVFVLFLFGFAINLDINHIRLAVFDRDQSQLSRRLCDKFIQSCYYDLVERVHAIEQITSYVDTRKAKVALHIPLHFSRDIRWDRATPVQIIIDAADNNTANIILGYSSAVMATVSREMLEELIVSRAMNLPAPLPGIDLLPAIWYNPELKTSFFMVPALSGLIREKGMALAEGASIALQYA